MMSFFHASETIFGARVSHIRSGFKRFFQEDKGDIVSSLGWMAIMALALVAIKGIIDGKLVSYVNTVFVHLDKVFNP